MSTEIVRVVARFVAAPEKAEELRDLLATLLEPTQAEDGCLRCELLQNQADPADFVLIEEWQNAEALDEHLASAHMLDVLGRIGGITAAQPEVHQYRPVA